MPDLLTPDTVLAHRSSLRALPLPDGGLTLYASEGSTAYVMNASAAQVWSSIDGRTRLALIVERLRRAHADVGDVSADVARIATDLHEAGLVQHAVAADEVQS